MKHIEIITIGDELLDGRLVDTNARELSARLADAGYRVARHLSIGDDRAVIVEALRASASRSDAVLVSGGLGPTVDDLTAEAAAEAFDLQIVRHPAALAHVRAFFAERGRTMSPNNEKQADLPEGCELLPNPGGTAVGFRIVADGCRLSFMPGVPSELLQIFDSSVLPDLQSIRRPTRPLVKTLKVFGKGESDVAQMLDGLGDDLPDGVALRLQFRASFPEIHVRLQLEPDAGRKDRETLERIAEEATRRLGVYLFAAGDGAVETSFADRVVADLNRAGLGFAVAEGCTGGAIAQLILGSPDSSPVFAGGVVAPAGADRRRLLGVDSEEVDGWGTASPEDAVEMAEAIRERCVAELGLAVFGKAARSDDLGEGHLVVAVAAPTGSSVREFDFPLEEDRFRTLAAYIGLSMLRRSIAPPQSQ
jgi:nicotinamide-nucleotide amidase